MDDAITWYLNEGAKPAALDFIAVLEKRLWAYRPPSGD
jgi:hypothetical protein